eukprot:m.187983 g.187983  ORF g.187983 m.187983 type:complete len:156 (+) comp53590_c0_seq2:82-549(+)
MWFAALGHVEHNAWLVQTCLLLMEGSERIFGLLAKEQYFSPQRSPKFVRILRYDYWFTNATQAALQPTMWWTRELRWHFMYSIEYSTDFARNIRKQVHSTDAIISSSTIFISRFHSLRVSFFSSTDGYRSNYQVQQRCLRSKRSVLERLGAEEGD